MEGFAPQEQYEAGDKIIFNGTIIEITLVCPA